MVLPGSDTAAVAHAMPAASDSGPFPPADKNPVHELDALQRPGCQRGRTGRGAGVAVPGDRHGLGRIGIRRRDDFTGRHERHRDPAGTDLVGSRIGRRPIRFGHT